MTALRTCGNCHKNYQDNGLDVCDNCKPKQDNWEEEFDNLFYRIDRFDNTGVIYGKGGGMTFAESDKSQLTAIKNFIRTEIEKAEKRGYKQGEKDAMDSFYYS